MRKLVAPWGWQPRSGAAVASTLRPSRGGRKQCAILGSAAELAERCFVRRATIAASSVVRLERGSARLAVRPSPQGRGGARWSARCFPRREPRNPPACRNQRKGDLTAENRHSKRIPNLKRSAPDWIRTSDLRFRRPTLYPAELRARGWRSGHRGRIVGREAAGAAGETGSLVRRGPAELDRDGFDVASLL